MNKELTYEELWKQAAENWKKPMTMDEYFRPYRLPQCIWLQPKWLIDVYEAHYDNTPCIYGDPRTRLDYLFEEFHNRMKGFEAPSAVTPKKPGRIYKAYKWVDEFLFGRLEHDKVFVPHVTVCSGL